MDGNCCQEFIEQCYDSFVSLWEASQLEAKAVSQKCSYHLGELSKCQFKGETEK